MSKPRPEVTHTGQRFKTKMFLSVDPETGVLLPSDIPQQADYKITLTVEYPTYEDELNMKQKCQYGDDTGNLRLDWDKFVEYRVRRCLVQWDMHERIPDFTEKLLRINNMLDDESMLLWKKLPPLVRKEIARIINIYMGSA